jgi:GDP-4-dehydro-6-deoxy-D-mannose reductase
MKWSTQTSPVSATTTRVRAERMHVARRILITGAGGFVGRYMTARLAGLPGAEVLATGRPGGAFLALDVTDAEAVDALVARFRPTCVLHLAAIASPVQAAKRRRLTWDVNLFGTMNLAEAVLRHTSEARFIFAGSSEVYGGTFNAIDGTVDEQAPLAPRNVYAATKAAADLLMNQMAEVGLKSIRFRPFNHTGPGQSTDFVVPAFAAQVAAAERGEGPSVIRVGNLEVWRDFLDVRDVVEAYTLAVLKNDLPAGTVLNVASGQPRRMRDILDDLLGLSAAAISIEHDEARMRPNDVPVAVGNASCARALLGWAPTVPWDVTLRDVLDHHRRAV